MVYGCSEAMEKGDMSMGTGTTWKKLTWTSEKKLWHRNRKCCKMYVYVYSKWKEFLRLLFSEIVFIISLLPVNIFRNIPKNVFFTCSILINLRQMGFKQNIRTCMSGIIILKEIHPSTVFKWSHFVYVVRLLHWFFFWVRDVCGQLHWVSRTRTSPQGQQVNFDLSGIWLWLIPSDWKYLWFRELGGAGTKFHLGYKF